MAKKKSKQDISKEVMFNKIMPSLNQDTNEGNVEVTTPKTDSNFKATPTKNAAVIKPAAAKYIDGNKDDIESHNAKASPYYITNENINDIETSRDTIPPNYITSENINDIEATSDTIPPNYITNENINDIEISSDTISPNYITNETMNDIETISDTITPNYITSENINDIETISDTIPPNYITNENINDIEETSDTISPNYNTNETMNDIETSSATIPPNYITNETMNDIETSSATIPPNNKIDKSDIEEKSKQNIQKTRTTSSRRKLSSSKPRTKKVIERTEENEFEVINLNEELINKRFDMIFKKFHCCHCVNCRSKVMALALNELPAKYIVVKTNEHDKIIREADDSHIRPAIIQATLKLMMHPIHSDY